MRVLSVERGRVLSVERGRVLSVERGVCCLCACAVSCYVDGNCSSAFQIMDSFVQATHVCMHI